MGIPPDSGFGMECGMESGMERRGFQVESMEFVECCFSVGMRVLLM